MKISVELINSYLEKPLKTDEMVSLLERTEVEVEEILYATKLDNKIVIAKVLETSKHPNADKLKLVKVETLGGVIDIVCGAPNVRAGIVVALAQVGTILPDGAEIGEAKIRGEVSHGMLCSERELGWGDDHSGIVELDPSFPLGQSLCDIAKSIDVLDIKTPSNRWDYLSYIGLAREISAFVPENRLIEPENRELIYHNREVVKVNNKGECKVFASVKLRVKANAQSPRWLVDNLQAAGMRSINPVVDITNFVMLETGQPSHAYDATQVSGSLGVRFALSGESLTTLDGKKLKLDKEDLLIVDNSGPIGLAGVMGGQKTETKANSEEIILEVANFNKTTVRRSALRHGLRTEASLRFERGLPLPLPEIAMNRIVSLLQDICGAEVVDSPVLQQYEEYATKYLGMRIRKAEKFLGYKLNEKDVARVLERRGFKASHFSFSKEIKDQLGKPYMYGAQIASEKLEKFDCSLLTQYIYAKSGVKLGRTAQLQFESGMEVPDFGLKPGDLLFLRGDEKTTKKAIGHVGMFAGNGKVLQASSTQKKVVLSPLTKFTKANNYAGARRYVDNFNHIISVEVPWWRDDVSMDVDLFEEVAKALGYEQMPETLPQLPPTDTTKHQLLPALMQLRNRLVALGLFEVMTYPFVSREDILKTNGDLSNNLQIENPLNSEQDYLRSNMLSSHFNAWRANSQHVGAAIFEISRVYHKQKLGASETWKIALSITGENSLLRLMGAIDKLVGWYGSDVQLDFGDNPNFITGRCAKIKDLGEYGQVGSSKLNEFGISFELSYAEIDVQKIVKGQKQIKVNSLPPYQLIEKDITVEVGSATLWQDVKASLPKSVRATRFIDEFTNSDLEKDRRRRVSFAVQFDLGPNPRSKQINNEINKCHDALSKIDQAKVL